VQEGDQSVFVHRSRLFCIVTFYSESCLSPTLDFPSDSQRMLFCSTFFVVLTGLFAMTPIHWSGDHLPFIDVLVNGQPEQRAIDLGSSNNFVVYGSSGTRDVDIRIPGLNLNYTDWVTHSSALNVSGLLPVGPMSTFASREDLHWFTITVGAIFLTSNRNMRLNRGQFCENASEVRIVPAFPGQSWGGYTMDSIGFFIDSVDPNIHLPRANFDLFVAEVHLQLGIAGYTYTFDETTTETIIRNCDMNHLDLILPELDFSLASTPIRGASYSPMVDDESIPHNVRLSGKDFLRTTLDGDCHLGVVVSNSMPNDPYPRLGSVIFRSHAISFHQRSRSMIICRARDPILA